MNCEHCHGTGYTKRTTVLGRTLIGLCPECYGMGIRHCCDGEHVDLATNRGARPSKGAAQRKTGKQGT